MKKIISLILLLVVGLVGCGRQKEAAREIKIPVEAMRVEKADLKEILSFTGNIKAQDEAIVYSEVTGKLIENKVEEGNQIKKDDTIALIDRDEVGFKFKEAIVDSPIDGTVGRIYLDRGESVSPNTSVAMIINMDQVKVEVDILERDVPRVFKGQIAEIKIDAYPGEVFTGKVSKVSPVIDTISRTAPAEINIPNPDHRLKSGMFARSRIVVEEHRQVPVILRDAIIKESGHTYCFVIRDNQACKRKILLGMAEANFVEVVSGLEPGELVVITGHQGLKDGALIDIIRGDE